MKKLFIYASLLAGILTFSACESDRDSNPTLLEPTEFVLNTPALADGVYDLNHAESVELTCSQPNYGYTAAVTYSVQITLDDSFKEAQTLPTSFNTAKMNVSASEMAITLTNMLVAEGKKPADFPMTIPVKLRLKAELSEGQGTILSNSIDLKFNLKYSLPPLELPEQMYLIGKFCDWKWDKAPEMVPINSHPGMFWRMVYLPAGEGFKFNKKASWNGSEVGFEGATVNDHAGAGVSNGGGNINVDKGGWYIVVVKVEIDGSEYKYTVDLNKPDVYLFGPANGNSWEPKEEWIFTVPADATGYFVSPAFAANASGAAGGLRACIVVPECQWWHTEFMVFDGILKYRGTGGDQERVDAAAGQRLYINFTNDTGKIE